MGVLGRFQQSFNLDQDKQRQLKDAATQLAMLKEDRARQQDEYERGVASQTVSLLSERVNSPDRWRDEYYDNPEAQGRDLGQLQAAYKRLGVAAPAKLTNPLESMYPQALQKAVGNIMKMGRLTEDQRKAAINAELLGIKSQFGDSFLAKATMQLNNQFKKDFELQQQAGQAKIDAKKQEVSAIPETKTELDTTASSKTFGLSKTVPNPFRTEAQKQLDDLSTEVHKATPVLSPEDLVSRYLDMQTPLASAMSYEEFNKRSAVMTKDKANTPDELYHQLLVTAAESRLIPYDSIDKAMLEFKTQRELEKSGIKVNYDYRESQIGVNEAQAGKITKETAMMEQFYDLKLKEFGLDKEKLRLMSVKDRAQIIHMAVDNEVKRGSLQLQEAKYQEDTLIKHANLSIAQHRESRLSNPKDEKPYTLPSGLKEAALRNGFDGKFIEKNPQLVVDITNYYTDNGELAKLPGLDKVKRSQRFITAVNNFNQSQGNVEMDSQGRVKPIVDKPTAPQQKKPVAKKPAPAKQVKRKGNLPALPPGSPNIKMPKGANFLGVK